ncbi:hypothetical protein ID866_11447 [Astraeus odoratus]|nr:hypothetical protein ID866_11447 [Astraeus odoratus]
MSSLHMDPPWCLTASYVYMLAHWRQVHFQPHPPLPRDVGNLHSSRQSPMLRTVLEIVSGILCLGIPVLFVDRAIYISHFNVEGNVAPPSSTPLFIVGACACLVSAIIISASVTLITLSGTRQHRSHRRSSYYFMHCADHSHIFRLCFPV